MSIQSVCVDQVHSDLLQRYVERSDWKVSENANMAFSLQGVNNDVASEVTHSYWLERVYSETVRAAHRDGALHLHDLNALAVYCVGWDLAVYPWVTPGIPARVEPHPSTARGLTWQQHVGRDLPELLGGIPNRGSMAVAWHQGAWILAIIDVTVSLQTRTASPFRGDVGAVVPNCTDPCQNTCLCYPQVSSLLSTDCGCTCAAFAMKVQPWSCCTA